MSGSARSASVPPTSDAVRSWVEASCAAQGVPVLVRDPAVVRQVGVLLAGRRAGGCTRGSASIRPAPTCLQPPDCLHPVRVEPAPADEGGRVDDDVVDHGLDDRDLPAQVQLGPARA
jgi:hypothetical protein